MSITFEEFFKEINNGTTFDLPDNFLRCMFNGFDKNELETNFTANNHPFFTASLYNNCRVLRVLMELPCAKEIINKKLFNGSTLLTTVISNGCVECMDLLLKNGADPSIVDGIGCTAKYYANNSGILDAYEKSIKEINKSETDDESKNQEIRSSKNNKDKTERVIEALTTAINILKED